MNLLDTRITQDPVIALIVRDGMEVAAKSLNMTIKQLENEVAIKTYLWSSQRFAEEQLKIVNKEGNIQPLRYNKGQKKICEAKERQQIAGKPVRIALLKARQFGGSTLEEGDVFKESVLRAGRSSMIIAHDLDSARHLRQMSTTFYEHYELPKPRIKKESEKWWKFLHRRDGRSFDSNLRIDTAEELSTGHSLTLHHLHLSEVQNWRNATVLVKGLFPTVPNSPDTTIFMEGTGSGVGDYWYDFCQMAMQDDSTWEFVFVAWYEIEDYTLSFDNETKKNDFEAKLDDEEKTLRKRGVSLEQLHWRRITLEKTYKGDADAFRQQYPADADEAFLTSGRPVFKQKKIRENLQKCIPNLGKGYLIWNTQKNKVNFTDDEHGYWEIWEEADRTKENLYCLGADVAEGIAVIPELGNRGGDYSCAKVLRRDTRKFVARIHERLDPDMFADELQKAWLYWNCGMLIENNPGGSGNVVLYKLKQIPGINLLKTVTIDRVHDTRKEEYGWDTNQESKRLMIDELGELIREDRFTDHSKNFWIESSTYVRDEKGRTNAQSRKFDDEVIAEAITFQADKLLPMVFTPVVEKRKEYTRDMDIPENWKSESGKELQTQVMEENFVA